MYYRRIEFLCLICVTISLGLAAIIPPNHPFIRYTGRVAKTTDSVIYDWSCVRVEANLTGTSLYVSMNGGGNHFIANVDGVETKFATNNAEELYLLAGELKRGPHHVVLTKITEASYFGFEPLLPLSRVIFKGFWVAGDKAGILPLHEEVKPRKIEVIGDSNSNGFGIDGPDDVACMLELTEYENCYESYGAVIARALDANIHIEAWTGLGVVKNAVALVPGSAHPMPYYINRTLATDANITWDFKQWVPDLVLVMLGCNDYLTWPLPSDEQFIQGYTDMLINIFNSYNKNKNGLNSENATTIISLCGGRSQNNMEPCRNVQTAISRVITAGYKNCYYIGIGEDWIQYPQDYGCLGHRNVQGQSKIASHLIPKIKAIMKW